MKFDATIVDVLPERSGTSKNGDYKFVPIVVEIPEQCHRLDGTTFVRSNEIKVDIGGRYANNFSLSAGTNVTIDICFDVREYDGKKYRTARSNYLILR